MSHVWVLVLLLSFASVNLAYYLSPTNLNTGFSPKAVSVYQDSRPYKSKRADDPDVIPSSPPWVFLANIPYPPHCMISSDSSTCPYNESIVSSCTATKCTKTLFGACIEHGNMTDKSCFCSSLSADSCHSCSSDTQRAFFLGWLNATCGDVPGWNGAMPTGWQNNTRLGPQMVAVDNYLGTYYGYGFYSYSPIGVLVSSSDAWLENIYNASSIVAVNASFGEVVDPVGYDPISDWKRIFLDTSGFCSSIYQNTPVQIDTPANKAQVLLWASAICDNATTGIHEYPLNWKDSLSLGGPNFDRSNTFPVAPKCFNQPACSLSKSQTDCASEQCILASGVNCDITEMVDMPCFCKDLNFRTTCTERCHLSWERAQLLHWLDNRCGNITGWAGLPDNWRSLLQVQENELVPEKWRKKGHGFIITPNSNSTSTELEHYHCPSAASKLGAFAAVNIVMALFIPILGRRDVLKKISLGLCGRRGSMLWMLTGPAAAALHISGNAIGAVLIKTTPGFSSVNVGQLILLWCTRPRVSWMIIIMVPFQSKDAIYTSVATSTLFAEVILQFLGAYCMVVATNYARKQKFYLRKALTNASTPKGRDAGLMYAGSLLWLTAIVFAVVVCTWSILGISDYAKALNNKAIARKAERAQRKLLETRARVENVHEGIVTDYPPEPGFVMSQVETSSLEVQTELRVLEAQWERLHKYLATDFSVLKDTEDSLTRAEKLLKQAKRNHDPALEAAEDETDKAQAEYSTALDCWNSIPKTQLGELGNPSYWVQRRDKYGHDTHQNSLALKTLLAAKSQVNKSHVILKKTWQEQERQRAKEVKEASVQKIRLLRIIAWRTIAGMMLCWIAQWLWWTGFVRVMGDSYCPPKLGTVATLWTVFSIFGVFIGGSA